MVLTKMFGAVRRRVAHSQNLARISSQMQSPSSWRSCCVAAKEITIRDALNSALDEDMSANSKVYLMGEEVGEYQGAYKVSKGLLQKFGPDGMLDTSITEILHLLDSRHETIMNQTMASSRLKVLNMETLGALETNGVMSISFMRLLHHGPKLYQMLGSKAKMNMRVEMQRPCSQMKSNLGYLRNVHRNPSPLLSRRMHSGDEIWNNLGYSRVCHRHQKLSIRQFSEAGHSFMKKFHFSTVPPAEGSSSSDACNSSETISVTFIDKHGDKKTVKVPLGMSMLEAAHQNDIELEGACEGSLACSTCHVIVMDEEYYNKLPEPTDEENDMLDLAFGLTETSRLGCQVIAKPELEGMRLAIPSATRNFAVDGYVPKPH